MSERDRHESVQERDAADGQNYQQEELLGDELDSLTPDPQTPESEDLQPDMGKAVSHPPDESPASNQ